MRENVVGIKYEYANRNLLSGLLFGVGLIAFVDEMIFHQLLHWHHFYDRSTTSVGLISDGLFHALSWFATIGGLYMFADLRRRQAVWKRKWASGVWLGAGIFQLYDGIIQHKVMGIHQIRYVENVIFYDIAWNLIAIVMIATGAMLLKQSNGEAERFQNGEERLRGEARRRERAPS